MKRFKIHGSVPENRSKVVIFVATNISSALCHHQALMCPAQWCQGLCVFPGMHGEPEDCALRVPISQTKKLRLRKVLLGRAGP